MQAGNSKYTRAIESDSQITTSEKAWELGQASFSPLSREEIITLPWSRDTLARFHKCGCPGQHLMSLVWADEVDPSEAAIIHVETKRRQELSYRLNNWSKAILFPTSKFEDLLENAINNECRSFSSNIKSLLTFIIKAVNKAELDDLKMISDGGFSLKLSVPSRHLTCLVFPNSTKEPLRIKEKMNLGDFVMGDLIIKDNEKSLLVLNNSYLAHQIYENFGAKFVALNF